MMDNWTSFNSGRGYELKILKILYNSSNCDWGNTGSRWGAHSECEVWFQSPPVAKIFSVIIWGVIKNLSIFNNQTYWEPY